MRGNKCKWAAIHVLSDDLSTSKEFKLDSKGRIINKSSIQSKRLGRPEVDISDIEIKSNSSSGESDYSDYIEANPSELYSLKPTSIKVLDTYAIADQSLFDENPIYPMNQNINDLCNDLELSRRIAANEEIFSRIFDNIENDVNEMFRVY